MNKHRKVSWNSEDQGRCLLFLNLLLILHLKLSWQSPHPDPDPEDWNNLLIILNLFIFRPRMTRRARPSAWPPTPTPWRTTRRWTRSTAASRTGLTWCWGSGRRVWPGGSRASCARTAAGWTSSTDKWPGRSQSMYSLNQTTYQNPNR